MSLGLRTALEKYSIPGKIVLLGTPGLCMLKKVSSRFIKFSVKPRKGVMVKLSYSKRVPMRAWMFV